MKEKEIQNQILEALNNLGFLAFPVQTQGQFNAKKGKWLLRKNKYELRGQADITCWLGNGKILYIEVKTDKTKNKLRDSQKEFKELAHKFGFDYICVFNLDQVLDFIRALGYQVH